MATTSTTSQRQIALDALKLGPQSTIDLRHTYGIMQPAPRIKELRDIGYQIETVFVEEETPDSIKHNKVARYILVREI
jgi:hypothetical protein